MKVTIITATYNSAKTLRDTLKSVEKQTYKNIEHIIIDGASTDNTLTILKEFTHNIVVLSEPDKGIYDAMNKGIALATGDVIGILNSDDFYANNRVIEKVVAAMEVGDAESVYGDLLFVDSEDGKNVMRKWVAGGYNDNLFYRGWMPPHPTLFVKRELYKKYGCFNLSFKTSADYELILRFLFLHRVKASYIGNVLVHMRLGGQSTQSLSNRLAAHKEDYMAWVQNGLQPKWYTLALKPIRKINQFVFLKRSIFNRGWALRKQPAFILQSIPGGVHSEMGTVTVLAPLVKMERSKVASLD